MFYLKRILKAILSIFVIASISFLIVNLIPGNPAQTILGVDAPAEKIELFNEMFGLDKPLFTRYVSWLSNVIKGDFGISFRYLTPVKNLIIDSLPITIILTIMSVVISFLVSVLLSFYLNKLKNKKLLKFFDFLLSLCISIPSFFLALLFILIFSVSLRLLNVGYDDSISSLILPAIIISIPKIGQLTYNIRENLYIETRQEYIKYLYSNGMKLKYLNLYVLKNAILPVLPILGLMIIDLITGIVIVEQVFSIPGIGRLMVSSVYSRDIPLVQALIVYTSFVVIVINLIIDILYLLFDKRIRRSKEQ